VLTASYWPPQIVAPSACRFSGDLSKALEVFHKFYDGRHSGRRLTWQSNLGTADVRVRFKARAHDLNLSTQALAVLLLFEDVRGEDYLSFKVREWPIELVTDVAGHPYRNGYARC
jgi:cullin 3